MSDPRPTHASTVEQWEPVPVDEISTVLDLFSARGQGRLCDHQLRRSGLTLSAAGPVSVLTLTASHPAHGTFAVHLDDPQVKVFSDAVSLAELSEFAAAQNRASQTQPGCVELWPYRQAAPTAPTAPTALTGDAPERQVAFEEEPNSDIFDAISAVATGTWEVHDSAEHLYGTAISLRRTRTALSAAERADATQAALDHLADDPSATVHAYTHNWLGSRQATVHASALRVEKLRLAAGEGCCPACGHHQFQLRFGLTTTVEVTGAGTYRVIGPSGDAVQTPSELLESLHAVNSFARLVCRACGTESPDNHNFSQVRAAVGGLNLQPSSVNLGQAAGSLSDILYRD